MYRGDLFVQAENKIQVFGMKYYAINCGDAKDKEKDFYLGLEDKC